MNTTVMTVAGQAKVALNRMVFNGIESYSSVFTVPASRVRGAELPRRQVSATATVPLDRLGAELASAGLHRSARAPEAETWTTAAGIDLSLYASAAETSNPEEAMVREYASLLTNTEAAGDATMHVTVPAALPAVWWWRHRGRGASIEDSPEIEDIIELVIRHPQLTTGVHQLPEELRRVVSEVAGRLASDGGCEWAICRALPDARHTPDVVNDVVELFKKLSQV